MMEDDPYLLYPSSSSQIHKQQQQSLLFYSDMLINPSTKQQQLQEQQLLIPTSPLLPFPCYLYNTSQHYVDLGSEESVYCGGNMNHLMEHQQQLDFFLGHPNHPHPTATTTTTTTPAAAAAAADRNSKKRSGGGGAEVKRNKVMKAAGGVTSSSSSRKKRCWRKDRHSKIVTAQGPRDRRMRLSLKVARPFFGLQDKLGFDKPSKTVEWLLTQSRPHIERLFSSSSNITQQAEMMVKMNHMTMTTTPPPPLNSAAASPPSRDVLVEKEEEEEEEGDQGEGVDSSNITDDDRNDKEMRTSTTSASQGPRSTTTTRRGKSSPLKTKTKMNKKKAAGRVVGRESRDKARERARQRTKDKKLLLSIVDTNHQVVSCKSKPLVIPAEKHIQPTAVPMLINSSNFPSTSSINVNNTNADNNAFLNVHQVSTSAAARIKSSHASLPQQQQQMTTMFDSRGEVDDDSLEVVTRNVTSSSRIQIPSLNSIIQQYSNTPFPTAAASFHQQDHQQQQQQAGAVISTEFQSFHKQWAAYNHHAPLL